ncbi:hypothetical protein [Sphingomonas sp. LM7]|uniref:hypothetical protein n=1 Tax=Sphingomonas sp. LM7 TaxID=1938607 RepID=UPI000983B461|nr:hypothetical protein [Sphingomonas sp. LM7]AQR74107.1 hypothetical protein BXU08_10995 [Sphingomonas sp. LM7]
MSIVLALGLMAAIDPALPAIEHRTRVKHAEGAVDALYKTRVSISHRQIGSATKPGTPATLRCVWRANIHVERSAVHGSGASLSRQIARDGVVEGHQPGWCNGGRNAIAAQVARRTGEIHDQVVALAREDESVLQAELERLNGNRQG